MLLSFFCLLEDAILTTYNANSAMASAYSHVNNSFSGCDMIASVDLTLPDGTEVTKVLGSLYTLTYSIFQKKNPVRSVGKINAKDYTYGYRTIAGSLVFIVFDRHWAYSLMSDYTAAGGLGSIHFLVDELPPFNITLTFSNEYGVSSRMALYGVRCVNEGQTLSMSDIYTENTYQFLATDIDYMMPSNGYSSGDTGTGATNLYTRNAIKQIASTPVILALQTNASNPSAYDFSSDDNAINYLTGYNQSESDITGLVNSINATSSITDNSKEPIEVTNYTTDIGTTATLYNDVYATPTALLYARGDGSLSDVTQSVGLGTNPSDNTSLSETVQANLGYRDYNPVRTVANYKIDSQLWQGVGQTDAETALGKNMVSTSNDSIISPSNPVNSNTVAYIKTVYIQVGTTSTYIKIDTSYNASGNIISSKKSYIRSDSTPAGGIVNV